MRSAGEILLKFHVVAFNIINLVRDDNLSLLWKMGETNLSPGGIRFCNENEETFVAAMSKNRMFEYDFGDTCPYMLAA